MGLRSCRGVGGEEKTDRAGAGVLRAGSSDEPIREVGREAGGRKKHNRRLTVLRCQSWGPGRKVHNPILGRETST